MARIQKRMATCETCKAEVQQTRRVWGYGIHALLTVVTGFAWLLMYAVWRICAFFVSRYMFGSPGWTCTGCNDTMRLGWFRRAKHGPKRWMAYREEPDNALASVFSVQGSLLLINHPRIVLIGCAAMIFGTFVSAIVLWTTIFLIYGWLTS